ncbi:ArnT family glycosyltransferase [Patescibacteria group bacterium]
MKKGSAKTQLWSLAAIGIVVFLSTLFLTQGNGLYISPDESANAFFAKQFSETGTLQYFEPLNLKLADLLHPRSMVSLYGQLVPSSFVGLPVLFGIVGFAFGEVAVNVVTPFLALLAVLAWYGLVKKVFDQKIAWLSAVVLAFHPAWWYYQARSMMHNVLFVSLLIFGGYFLLRRPFVKHQWLNELSSGLFFGLSIFVRGSEVIWIFLALLFLGIIYRSRLHFRTVVIFLGSIAIALLPMLVLNQSTYGHPFEIGYTAKSQLSETLIDPLGQKANQEQNKSLLLSFRTQVEEVLSPAFPFGLHPRAILRNVYSHGLALFWWLTILAVIGFLVFILKISRLKNRQIQGGYYLWFFLGITAWLAIMYGSWTFSDNPDPKAITIGNSYLRYWLPVFVLSTPLIAQGISWLAQLTKNKTTELIAVVVLLTACLALSTQVVFATPGDGLIQIKQTLIRSKEIQSKVLRLIEPGAVIIVDRADKIFFPHRSVLQPLRSDQTYKIMPKIAELTPLYYYGVTFPKVDFDYLNQERLENNLQIQLIETFDAESLYRIE